MPQDADVGDVQYNERFYWKRPEDISNYFKDSLRQGTPFPILSLAEYFTLNQEGFSWGGEYREAGYYATVMLWYDYIIFILSIMNSINQILFRKISILFSINFLV